MAKKVVYDEEEGEMDMSPMIDMVFLLLIFFIVNATAITVKKDPTIAMPVASNGGDVQSANGAIVLNIYNTEKADGHGPDVLWGTDEGKPLRSEEELSRYIKEKAELFTSLGYKEAPGLSLYIRGDKESIYKNAKTAINVAAQHEVINIMFATVL